MSKKNKKYTSLEKKAYYTGLGVGLTGESPTQNVLCRNAMELMTENERVSFFNGVERGRENASVRAGIRAKNKWF